MTDRLALRPRKSDLSSRYGAQPQASRRRPFPAEGFWICLLLSLGATATQAHQLKESVTKVLFNERTGNIEVMQRFYLHDAEHAVQSLVDGSADLLASTETQAWFARYAHERFLLKRLSREPIALQPVGVELEGRYIWVYSEAPIPPDLEGLSLSHQGLRDVWPEQVNLVNVERAGEVLSALFTGTASGASSEGFQSIRFSPSSD